MSYPLKVLILEDNDADAEMIRYLLKKNSYHFESQVMMDKEAYLQALDEFKPDIILSDNDMPQFSASKALEILKQRSLHIPFILVTGTVSEEFAASIIKAGADDYLLKDRLTRLPAAIESALKQKQTEKEKQQSLDSLTQSEAKYRTLVEQAFDGIIIYSPSGIIQECNYRVCNSLGFSQEELKGLNIIELFFKEDLAARPLYFETLKEGKPVLDYRRIKKKDGGFLEMEIGTKMTPDGNLMAIGRDITERKAAEQKIIQSEENLKAIFDNTSESFILTNKEGVVKIFNGMAKSRLLLTVNKKIEPGMPMTDFIEESRRVFFKQLFARVMQGESIQYDRSYNLADGQITWLNVSLNPVWKGDYINGICITGRDITEKKKAEELLHKNFIEKKALAGRMSSILNTLPANIALLDNTGIIIEVNDAWRNFADDNGFIGSSYGIGDNYIDISKKSSGDDEIDGKAVAHGIKEVLKNKTKEFVFEYPCHSPEIKRWFRMVVSPLQEKEYAGAVVMHIDISELRRLEKERLESKMDEQKKITSIIFNAQEKERNAIGVELHDNVNQILVGTNLVMRLIKDHPERIRELIPSCIDNIKSAIEENRKIAHELVTPDLKTETLLLQINNLCQTMLQSAGIQVHINEEDFNETLLNADQKLAIYRIAQEQCTNIIKYALAKQVILSLSTVDNLFIMRIIDDGQGKAADKISKGIGLRNMASRISVFGGSVNIDTQPGKGFLLEIEIPLL